MLSPECTLEKRENEPSATDNTEAHSIIEAASKACNIPIEKILGESRKHFITRARHVAMYLVRKRLGISYPKIGTLFGDRDHSTVMYGCDKIAKAITRNGDIQSLIESIQTKLDGAEGRSAT